MAVQAARDVSGVAVRVAAEPGLHYVDWPAIIAGAFLVVAVSTLLLTFGSAIGLSLTSFREGSALSVTGFVIAAALWMLWVHISSFLAGGYIAGRLRRRIDDATPHEVEVRDGCHGLIVWAVGAVIATILTAWVATLGTITAANVTGQGGTAVTDQSGATSSRPIDYYVDRLFRVAAPAGAEGQTPEAGTTAPGTATGAPAASVLVPEERQQIARVLLRGNLDEADRTFLVRQISVKTGVPETEAQARLEQITTSLQEAADRARRYAVLGAFITATSLLIGAVAAWWAAQKGGEHRDQGLDFSQYVRWR